MTVYLSGPMTGYKNYNKEGFDRAKEEVAKRFPKTDMLTVQVVNPHGISKLVEASARSSGREPEYMDYLHEDIKWMVDCDAVLTLDGWEKSRGSVIEVSVAGLMEIPVAHSVEELVSVIKAKKVRPGVQGATRERYDD
jgi:hypothetical protein